jgi:hypothetical protein
MQKCGDDKPERQGPAAKKKITFWQFSQTIEIDV